MKLTDSLKAHFHADVRQRGEQDLRDGAVQQLDSHSDGIHAAVLGRGLQLVGITYGRADTGELLLRAGCSCQRDETGLCEHIWAALLAAEQREGLRDALEHGEADTARIVQDYLPDDDADDDDADPSPGQTQPDAGDNPEEEYAGEDASPLRHIERVRTSFSAPLHGERAPRPGKARKRSRPRRGPTSRPSEWERALRRVAEQMQDETEADEQHRRAWPPDRQILYGLLPREADDDPEYELDVQVLVRQPRRDGSWGKPKRQAVSHQIIETLPDPLDRQILTLLTGSDSPVDSDWRYRYGFDTEQRRTSAAAPFQYVIRPSAQQVLVPLLCRTGRCILADKAERKVPSPLRWSDVPPWSLVLTLEADAAAPRRRYLLRGHLERDSERLSLSRPEMLTSGGLILLGDTIGRFDHHGAYPWVPVLRRVSPVPVPTEDARLMVEKMMSLPGLPPVHLPEPLQVKRERVRPRPMLQVHTSRQRGLLMGAGDELNAYLLFRYGEQTLAWPDAAATLFDRESWRRIERDRHAEAEAWRRLRLLGFREPTDAEAEAADLVIARRHLSKAVSTLVAEGWHVEAEGRLHRPAGQLKMDVRASGVDWFELHGEASFDGHDVPMPQLLDAMRKGEHFVTLDDGSVGLLPEQWLQRYASLGELGETTEAGEIRLRANQIGLIDALIAQMPEIEFDQQVAAAREKLRGFTRIEPRDAADTFHGTLRPYQRDGLGWLHFLHEMGFGGCLADDMGLGKTIQVLALLDARRPLREAARSGTGPSLVVAPRSLIHNWEAEAARFTPELRVLDHTGPQRFEAAGHAGSGTGRAHSVDHFHDYDLILTTYGTLRRDIVLLKDFRFDYAILDEAQAIKNPTTASAKAARLVLADHRLALSGTPIENHLGELFSLFEFLNPGMLGHARAWTGGNGNGRSDDAEAERRELIANAVRPFVLRRTKQQVAPELPERTEQTLYCDLQPKQRRLYNELRDHYRSRLMGRVDQVGLKRSKMQVLEALLRLRQAACHPGLVDKGRTEEASAKLDTLLPQIEEVLDEGHKALVFSQFTSFLSIVRKRLDEAGIRYEYLDGRTRDRGERVEHFQNDPDCRLFLISLKAGGLGLNLTAAEYVFLLDPWWNPAVEAQAIDRAHRIGQTDHVFAYRLIGRDTVEEKVLELQQSKRELADAIIRADANLIRALTVDDLYHLLS